MQNILGYTFLLSPTNSTLHRSTQHCSIIAINCTSLNKEFYGFSCMEMATKKCLVTLSHLFLAMQIHFIGQLSRFWPICTTFYNKKWINVSRTSTIIFAIIYFVLWFLNLNIILDFKYQSNLIILLFQLGNPERCHNHCFNFVSGCIIYLLFFLRQPSISKKWGCLPFQEKLRSSSIFQNIEVVFHF